jgi:N6-adenosine-specific RNA methylase IME4
VRAFHPVADVFPLIQGEKFKAFCEDVKTNGLRVPIVLHCDGRILDGRNRARACEATGAEPRYEQWDGDPGEEVSYVLSLNLSRRHLNESQRAMVADKLATLDAHRPARTASIDAVATQSEAANLLNVSRPSVQRARVVREHGTPELIEAVEQGEIAVSQAASLARAPEKTQREAVEKVKAGEKSADVVRRLVTEQHREERTRRIVDKSKAGDGPESTIRYPVLLADPPWRYDYSVSANREIENKYPTMSLDEICALKVADLTTESAVLYLWTTSPKLDGSLSVMRAWGFNYRSCLVWVKDKIGMGYWARQRHELLLVGTKGDMPAPPPELRPDSVIEAPRGEHSAKPVAVYELIEKQWPTMPKLELFARNPRDGWERWGHEA